ncbi:hypothetical protein K3495_g12934 [Podosphaera aphanis]|nr:hypothetical protein K3495_g12934 [Podosphaera aphanis]
MADQPAIGKVPEKLCRGLPQEFDLIEEYVNSDWKKGIVSIDNAKSINGYLIYKNIYYKRAEIYDELLHQTYQEDFEMWTRDVYSKANRDIIRLFRDTLRKYGCFVASNRITLARNLELALSEWHEWTDIEIKQQIRYGGFHPNSRFFVDSRTQLTKPISSQSQQIPQQQNKKMNRSNYRVYRLYNPTHLLRAKPKLHVRIPINYLDSLSNQTHLSLTIYRFPVKLLI